MKAEWIGGLRKQLIVNGEYLATVYPREEHFSVYYHWQQLPIATCATMGEGQRYAEHAVAAHLREQARAIDVLATEQEHP